MKIFGLIFGVIALFAGILLTGWVWYDAFAKGEIIEGFAYAGPVLIILGCLRIVRASAAVPLPRLAGLAIVGVAILVGYGHSAAIKAAFPGDKILASSNH